MTYNCKLLNDDILECDFTQTSVRRKQTKTLTGSEVKKLFKKEKIISSKLCKEMNLLLDYIYGKKPIPNKSGLENFSNMTTAHKKDMTIMLNKFQNLCQNYTIENLKEFLKISEEKEKKTCLVNSYNFSQKFTKTSNDTWSVIPEYKGSCRIIHLDRFEKDKLNNIRFWNYVSQKVITNKNSNDNSLIPCKELDENEYFFSWKSREIYFRCEYIKFGLF